MTFHKDDYYHTSKHDLYLASSQIPNAGLGVYTRTAIPPNTLIDEYTGYVRTSKYGGPYVFEVDEECYIDARDFPRCYMGMVNDCSYVLRKVKRKKKRWVDVTPDGYYDKNNQKVVVNCKFAVEGKRAYVYSIQEIPPDSELFLSYGEDYWK
jgi:hypothetical protein